MNIANAVPVDRNPPFPNPLPEGARGQERDILQKFYPLSPGGDGEGEWKTV